MKRPTSFARAELLTEGRYGARIMNSAQEIAEIIVKLKRRDIEFSKSVFLASAATKSTKTTEALDKYASMVFVDHERTLEAKTKQAMKDLDYFANLDLKELFPKGLVKKAAREHELRKAMAGMSDGFSEGDTL